MHHYVLKVSLRKAHAVNDKACTRHHLMNITDYATLPALHRLHISNN